MRYNSEDVRESLSGQRLRRELETDILGHYTYRRLSFFLTPFFLNNSISAINVSWLTMFVNLCIPVVAITGNTYAFIYVAALDFAFLILDYIDGNIARTTNTTSKLGAYMDSFSGLLHWICLHFAIGILVNRPDHGTFLLTEKGIIISLSLCLFSFGSRLLRKGAKALSANGNGTEEIIAFVPKELGSTKSILVSVFGRLNLYTPFYILFFGAINSIDMVLVFFAFFYLARFLVAQRKIFLSLKET